MQSTQLAIAVVTEWLANPNDPLPHVHAFVEQLVAERHPGATVAGLVELLMGLVNLSGRLLVDLTHVTDDTSEQLLQRLAARLR